ncbi:MAG: MBL fold metallo-hydrolase [Hyphomicrobiaceae bacterium]
MSVSVTFVGTGDAFGSGGRFNTCIIVDAPGIRFAIDFGASSLIALNRLGIEHNSIDLILLTHIHGDHCAGVPAMIMDAMLGAKRQKALTIAGPVDARSRLDEVAEAFFPGMYAMSPKFEVTTIEMQTLERHIIGGIQVTTYPAIHTVQTNPTSMRIEVAGRTIAYTGDSAWTKHIPTLAHDADLFITECYFYSKPVPFHMNYVDIEAHRDELKPKRMILTHMGPEMLARQNDVPEECAHDGLKVEV